MGDLFRFLRAAQGIDAVILIGTHEGPCPDAGIGRLIVHRRQDAVPEVLPFGEDIIVAQQTAPGIRVQTEIAHQADHPFQVPAACRQPGIIREGGAEARRQDLPILPVLRLHHSPAGLLTGGLEPTHIRPGPAAPGQHVQHQGVFRRVLLLQPAQKTDGESPCSEPIRLYTAEANTGKQLPLRDLFHGQPSFLMGKRKCLIINYTI